MANISTRTWLGCKDVTDSDEINKQAGEIAQLFAAFIDKTTKTLHIAIYDFHFAASQGRVVIDALNAAAEKGHDVRIAYFDQPAGRNARASGASGAPSTRASDLASLHKKIQVQPIKGVDINDIPENEREPIEGGGHLMHSKYMVRDGQAVWMGSANFTTDAFALQDNNIVQIDSAKIAQCYETDFEELWKAGRIAGTGKDDHGSDTVDGSHVEVDFSPGDGATIDQTIAKAIAAAMTSVDIASMVISSGAILDALAGVMAKGVKLSGVYDGPEMKVVLTDWGKSGKSTAKANQWKKVSTHLVPKWSYPYSPNGPHNFMHDKLVVVDEKQVITGSFNFSENATHNAENVLTMNDAAVAKQYAAYVASLVAAYKGGHPVSAPYKGRKR